MLKSEGICNKQIACISNFECNFSNYIHFEQRLVFLSPIYCTLRHKFASADMHAPVFRPRAKGRPGFRGRKMFR